MATIVGAITSSHVPAIGRAIAKNLQQDPYWKAFFDGYPPAQAWLAKTKPDVAVIFYNDHGLNFFLDKLPTFAVGAASEYRNADEGWGIPTVQPFKGDAALSWHLIESLVADEFDITMCQEMLVDHAATLPMALLWPGGGEWPVRIVPIAMNHVQHPLPSPRRCYHLGQAVGRALESWDEDVRVVVIGTGGPLAPARRQARRLHQQAVRPHVHGRYGRRSGKAHPVFDARHRPRGRGAGHRAHGVAGGTRCAHRSRDQGSLELPHPDFQHRDRADGARERTAADTAGARCLTRRPDLQHEAAHPHRGRREIP